MVAEVNDSRRLTGPNLLADRAGAVIDGAVSGVDVADFAAAWRARAREVLDAIGWADEITAERPYEGGLTVFLSAPVDALYAATELNEWAWAAAAADLGAAAAQPLGEALPRLRAEVDAELNPALIALAAEARRRGVCFLSDDDEASVGTGTGSMTWPVDDLPDPSEVPWEHIGDIPRVLVTGTNGKTTTVRMVAAIAAAAGRAVGFTCTDGIYVDGQLVDGGDWSGPGGARAVLRNPSVEVAVLETARGGMLRRGLAVEHADAAFVANVAADHLGEWGVLTVADVARAKLVVARAVEHGAPLIVNADDEELAAVALDLGRPITWIAVERVDWVREHAGGEPAWLCLDGWITRRFGDEETRLFEASSIPATLGGAARYNVSNALGAMALAEAIGLSIDAMREGLQSFDPTPAASPGRGNLFERDGARVMVDFVHNAHGLDAIRQAVEALAPARVGLMIGQAGDRDDDSIRDFVRSAWGLGPRRVAIKSMPGYERGRPVEEIPRLIRAEFTELGADASTLSDHDGEVHAATALLEWAEPGDFVLLSTQTDRDAVLRLAEAWAEGD